MSIIFHFDIDYLILDFNRPIESQKCLESVKELTKFDHNIIYLSNGGKQDYVLDFYQKGLIDTLICRKNNGGLGIGTLDLFRYCESEYAIYLQSDQYLGREFSANDLSYMINALDKKVNGETIKSISLAGNTCNGEFSERVFLVKTDFWNSIPNKPIGGAGPYHHLPWIEGHIQKYYKENNFTHYIWNYPLFVDNGCYAYRENPDGSHWCHRTDTKQLKLMKGPVKEKFIYPYFTDEEWSRVLNTQSWPDWNIPSNEMKSSFTFFKPMEDIHV